ncbi:MAG: hypothetical protein QM731_25515 [Chitinophagaceae bacterium]
MKLTAFLYSAVLISLIGAVSCGKSTDTYNTASATDYYMPLQVGKYIIYRLDTLKFINNQKDTIVSSQAKDLVAEAITDNLGRPAWRIVRYGRPLNSTDDNAWTPINTFTATYADHKLEFVEDNLRFVKLHEPFREGYSWLGNSYLPYTPYGAQYDFSNDEDIQKWNYTFEELNASVDINGKTYDSTVTVTQIADSNNVPIVYPQGIAYNNYWVEKYAKNIGLVYKQVIMWEYQPETSTHSSYTTGFGVLQTIISHN